MNRCVAKKDTAKMRWDVGHDLSEVCPWAGGSDELEAEKSQLWHWARVRVDQARTDTV